MDLIVCTGCGRPIAQALDRGAKLRGVCSACQPNPAHMLRFALAIRQARELADLKMAYCAARVGVSKRQWIRWEGADQMELPYDRRDSILSLFDGTKAAPVVRQEVSQWPS